MPAAIYMQARPRSIWCIVGTDRVTANGDVANKIGTYLKALAAKDNDVPFYVALPSLDHRLDAGDRAATFRSRNARRTKC